MSEAHVPTEHSPAGEEPRVQAQDVDARRPGDHRRQASQGSHAPQRLTRTWRLRGRASIETVRRARRRSAGPVWVRFAPAGPGPATPPAVGFAIGRHVGSAVVRNRVRRRLRAAVASLELAPGSYLVGADATAATMPFEELTEAVRRSITGAAA